MNTLMLSLLLTFTLNSAVLTTPGKQPGKRDRPTKLAHYQMSAYVSMNGKLNININKQLGGEVYVQLLDNADKLYFNRTMYAHDTTARFRLDLSELKEGGYTVKVSNGLEVELREVIISTLRPTLGPRSITPL